MNNDKELSIILVFIAFIVAVMGAVLIAEERSDSEDCPNGYGVIRVDTVGYSSTAVAAGGHQYMPIIVSDVSPRTKKVYGCLP